MIWLESQTWTQNLFKHSWRTLAPIHDTDASFADPFTIGLLNPIKKKFRLKTGRFRSDGEFAIPRRGADL